MICWHDLTPLTASSPRHWTYFIDFMAHLPGQQFVRWLLVDFWGVFYHRSLDLECIVGCWSVFYFVHHVHYSSVHCAVSPSPSSYGRVSGVTRDYPRPFSRYDRVENSGKTHGTGQQLVTPPLNAWPLDQPTNHLTHPWLSGICSTSATQLVSVSRVWHTDFRIFLPSPQWSLLEVEGPCIVLYLVSWCKGWSCPLVPSPILLGSSQRGCVYVYIFEVVPWQISVTLVGEFNEMNLVYSNLGTMRSWSTL